MYQTLILALLTSVGLSLALPSNDYALSARADMDQCALLDPAPDRSDCGKVGQLTRPSVPKNGISTAQSAACKTMHQCAEKCKSRDTKLCKSFSFNKASKKCKFYQRTVSQQDFKPNASSTTTFYDASCFKCSCVPNLLNGKFETGYINPWFPAPETEASIAKGHKSNYAISFAPNPTHRSNKTSYGSFYQYFTKCANVTYIIEFDYKWDTDGYGIEQLFVGAALAGSETGFVIWNTTTNHKTPKVWHHASTEWYSGTGKGAFIAFFATNKKILVKFMIDNISISRRS